MGSDLDPSGHGLRSCIATLPLPSGPWSTAGLRPLHSLVDPALLKNVAMQDLTLFSSLKRLRRQVGQNRRPINAVLFHDLSPPHNHSIADRLLARNPVPGGEHAGGKAVLIDLSADRLL